MVSFLTTKAEKQQYEPSYFDKRQPVILHKYRAGESRDVRAIFEELNKTYIKKLHIRDPYAASYNTKPRLEQFMTIIQNLASQIDEIQIDCRLAQPEDDYREYESELKNMLAPYANKVYANAYGYRKKKDFHDRRITVDTVDNSGCSEQICYELSGGISHLINDEFETAVTVFKPESFGK